LNSIKFEFAKNFEILVWL